MTFLAESIHRGRISAWRPSYAKQIADPKVELDLFGSFVCSAQPNQEYIDWFRQEMIELVDAKTRVSKPISF